MPGQGRRVKSGGARSKLWPTVTLQVAASSGAAASADPALQPPEAMPPPPPEPPITLAALEVRVGNMFPDEGECPQRSGCCGRWRSSTLKLIVAALVAVDSFWEACSDDVKVACAPAPIAKQEVLGYLLADLLGRPLLHESDAMAVGQRGENAVAAAKRKLQVKTVNTCWKRVLAGSTALDSVYDLKLPAATVGVKRSAAAVQASSERQQAAEQAAAAARAAREAKAARDARWFKWHGMSVGQLAEGRKRKRLERAVLARARQPRGVKEHAALAARMAHAARRDNQCFCEQGVPSFLCNLTWCWSTAAGYECEQRAGQPPGTDCYCHLPGTVDLDGQEVPVLGMGCERRHMYTRMETKSMSGDAFDFAWVDPPPGGWIGRDFCE